jgi:hypothetical protein
MIGWNGFFFEGYDTEVGVHTTTGGAHHGLCHHNTQMKLTVLHLQGVYDKVIHYRCICFLLCAEGLSSLLTHEEEADRIQGVRVCRGAPSVSHLLFADDFLILMKADMANATTLRQVLDTYCSSSGQLVSDPNSSIVFSPNTPVADKEAVCAALNINSEALTEKYLGLPSHVGIERSASNI